MTKRREQLTRPEATPLVGYDTVLTGVAELLESARRAAARATIAIMTATYWEIGRRISQPAPVR